MLCLLAEEKPELSCLTADASETYAWNWDDVSEPEKQKALDRMVEDYDKHECWIRGDDREFDDLKRQRKNVFTGRHVLKPKVVDGKLSGRARWTPRPFGDSLEGVESLESPTVHPSSFRTLESIGLKNEWEGVRGDVSSAFFKSKPMPAGREVWLEIPPEDPEFQEGKRMCRRLLKEVPGMSPAPRAWYDTLADDLRDHGAIGPLRWVRSKVDTCVWWLRDIDADECKGWLVSHVDDFRGRFDRAVVDRAVQVLVQLFGEDNGTETKRRMEQVAGHVETRPKKRNCNVHSGKGRNSAIWAEIQRQSRYNRRETVRRMFHNSVPQQQSLDWRRPRKFSRRTMPRRL